MSYLWLCAVFLLLMLVPRLAPAAPSQPSRSILFGMQSVPKFDETRGFGSWGGTRARGLAMHRDLGVQLSREGYPWPLDEPERGQHPNQADFDDAVETLASANIAIELMVTGTPFWASSAPDKRADQPESYSHAPPLNLYEPLFDDGTDIPGPDKRLNPHQYWGQLMSRIATRYRGQIRYYQIWNEPDFPKGELGASRDPARPWQGSAAEYVRLFNVAAIAVHHVDPAARVVTGGLGYPGYLQALIELGMAPFMDAVDFHVYGEPGSDGALRAFLSLESKLRQVLRHHHLQKPLLCSETGYSASDPVAQADYIPKLFGSALALGLEGVVYYSNTNPSWRQMGLIDWRTMQQRTAGYWAYKTTARALGGLSFGGKLSLPPQLVGYSFVDPHSSRQVYLVWAPYRDSQEPFPWTWQAAGEWRRIDPQGHGLRVHSGQRLELTETPSFFESDAHVAYPRPVPNPPRMVGSFQLRAVKASPADSSGFHEADLGVDGDPDSSWVSGGMGEAWFKIQFPAPAVLQGVAFKTGPMPHASLELVGIHPDGREETLQSEVRVSDWGRHELPFARPMTALALKLVWHRDSGAAAPPAQLFELEPR